MMRSIVRSPLWTWVKVVLALIALDWTLFRAGLFFRLVPELARDPVTWGFVYRCARIFAAPDPPPRAYAIGSSIVMLGLDEPLVRGGLATRKIPTSFTVLTVFGAGGVDSALLAHAALPTRPWLVVLTASVRDFPRRGDLDTPVSRVFLDASVDFPPLRATDVETQLSRRVREYWALYRYRLFVLMALQERLPVLEWLVPTALADEPPAPEPPEARRWFFPGRVPADAFAVWQRWRTTRRFEDYVEFLRRSKSAGLEQYGQQTLATHGPDENVQLDALAWAQKQLVASGVRVLVLDFPENPILREPEARGHYDPLLADAVAARLARDAAMTGARFVDLRGTLEVEDFYDMIHPNLEGARKLSARLADLVAEEWRSAGR
jgi:hypothetical protein